MAQKKAFYEQPVDRTPYGSCAWVGAVVAVFFCIAAWGIWHLAGVVKHSSLSLSLPSIHLPSSTSDVHTAADAQTENIRQQVNGAVQQQEQKAVDAASEAAKQEVQDQANKALQSQKSQYEKYLSH